MTIAKKNSYKAAANGEQENNTEKITPKQETRTTTQATVSVIEGKAFVRVNGWGFFLDASLEKTKELQGQKVEISYIGTIGKNTFTADKIQYKIV